MIEKVVWTQGAAQDYLQHDERTASSKAIDELLTLLMSFPELGTLLHGSIRIRRVLVPPKRVFGIYYAIQARRLIIIALLDLRRDPEAIENLLRERGMC